MRKLKITSFMKEARYLFAFLCLIHFSAYADKLGDSTYPPSPDLESAELVQAQKFLCEFKICINTPFAVKYKTGMKHVGYFQKNPPEIWIEKNLNTINKKLVLVHELSHVYRNSYNSKETRWLDEGLAKFWEYKFSNELWPVSYNTRFKKNPVLFLSNDEKHYGKDGEGYISSFYFIIYLYDHFGGEALVQKLMMSELSGWDNITNAINELRHEGLVKIPPEFTTPFAIFKHLAVALWTNEAYAAKYGLFYLNLNFEPMSLIAKPNYTSTHHRKHLGLSSEDSWIFYSQPKKDQKLVVQKMTSHNNVLNSPLNQSLMFSILSFNPMTIKTHDHNSSDFLESLDESTKVFIEAHLNSSSLDH